MPSVILHVGMPKTGTTTVQRALSASASLLEKNGILYPLSGRFSCLDVCHHALFGTASNNIKKIYTPVNAPDIPFESIARGIQHEQKTKGCHTVILSSEMLWSPAAFDETALIRIRRAFSGYHITIIAYLRPLEEHIASSYAQRVTGAQRYTGSFQQHSAEMENDGIYEYEKRINQFRSVFGADSVYTEWLPSLRNDVLLPLKTLIACEYISIPQEDSNQRKSWTYVRIMRYVNFLLKLRGRRLHNVLERMLLKVDPYIKNTRFLERCMEPANLQD